MFAKTTGADLGHDLVADTSNPSAVEGTDTDKRLNLTDTHRMAVLITKLAPILGGQLIGGPPRPQARE